MMTDRHRRGGAPPESLTDFVRSQYGRVVGVLALYTGDLELAEDLAQETFARLCRDWERVEVMEAPGAWIHRVALNLAHSSHRRRGAERRATERATRTAGERRGWSTDGEPGIDVDVRRALLALDDDERAVIVLRFFADLSVDETAATLGVPNGTVKTQHDEQSSGCARLDS